MDNEQPRMVRTRLRTTSDPTKGLQQLIEMVSAGEIAHGLIVSEMGSGEVHVMGQNASPEEMGRLLIIAGDALARAAGFDPYAASAPEAPQATPPTGEHTIAAAWASLEGSIFAADTPELQRSEMRRAFYAGAATLLGLMMDALDPNTDDATPADLSRMDGWKSELDTFGVDVQAGRA
jgi:hypothetical protein